MTSALHGGRPHGEAQCEAPALRLRRRALILLAHAEYGVVIEPQVAMAMLEDHGTIVGTLTALGLHVQREPEGLGDPQAPGHLGPLRSPPIGTLAPPAGSTPPRRVARPRRPDVRGRTEIRIDIRSGARRKGTRSRGDNGPVRWRRIVGVTIAAAAAAAAYMLSNLVG